MPADRSKWGWYVLRIMLLLGCHARCCTEHYQLTFGFAFAGKTTLLQILAGQYMVGKDAVRILGRPAFHDIALTSSGDLSYLGQQWRRDVAFAGYNVPLQVPSCCLAALPDHVFMSHIHYTISKCEVAVESRVPCALESFRYHAAVCRAMCVFLHFTPGIPIQAEILLYGVKLVSG